MELITAIILCIIGLIIFFQRKSSKYKTRTYNNSKLEDAKYWRAKYSGKVLKGEIIALQDGSQRMRVNGYVTTRELREDYQMTEGMIRKFFDAPDEIALSTIDEIAQFGDNGFQCNLYLDTTVQQVVDSDAFRNSFKSLQERRKKREELKEQKKRENEAKQKFILDKRTETLNNFTGAAFRITIINKYEWIHLETVTHNTKSAIALCKEWLKSEVCLELLNERYNETLQEYEQDVENFNDYKMHSLDGVDDLIFPMKPKKDEFSFEIQQIAEIDKNASLHEIDTIVIAKQGYLWQIQQ